VASDDAREKVAEEILKGLKEGASEKIINLKADSSTNAVTEATDKLLKFIKYNNELLITKTLCLLYYSSIFNYDLWFFSNSASRNTKAKGISFVNFTLSNISPKMTSSSTCSVINHCRKIVVA